MSQNFDYPKTRFWTGLLINITLLQEATVSNTSDYNLCPSRASLPQTCQGQGEKRKTNSRWILAHISLVLKSPLCSVMPRLCLGKLLQFYAIITSSKIRLFTAECHLLLPGKACSNNYTGHITIMNRAFHLQIQKCCAEVVSNSEQWGRGESQGEERQTYGQQSPSGQKSGQGKDEAQVPQEILLHLFLQAARLIQQ